VKRVPKAIYLSVTEIEQRIRERESVALRLSPATPEHRRIMQEIARLRIYAEAKRWLNGPSKQQA
jgi:hypothetical protein